MMHMNIMIYYERIFAFKQYHQWEISDIENLMPWEFDVMTSLCPISSSNKRLKKQQASSRNADK
jgi:hypothetical protein